MDPQTKKILCCEKLKAETAIYGALAPRLTDEELTKYNQAADKAIAQLERIRENILREGGQS